MTKANDQLLDYWCTENYHAFSCGLVLTDGAKELANRFKCWWFLDIIASYQSPSLYREADGLQVWILNRNADGSWEVRCEDGNDNLLRRQVGEHTDFSCDTATLWVQQNVVLLPSEY